MNRVRALIAEDEELAREALRRLIGEVEWVELVGEAADGRTAVERIDHLQPDLLFLDVKLPELSGLEVLQRVERRPLVVFTTAYEQFAVRAFEVEALDYLVKPFGARRFHETMERVRRRLETAPPNALMRLFARAAGGNIVPVPIREVTHFQAEGDYVRAFLPRASHLIYVTLSELETRLDAAFVRVHRSHIVNVGSIARIERRDDRRVTVVLRDGKEIVASRAGSAALRRVTVNG